MRFEGKLSKWNEERGFGFIAPLQGGQDIFVHISAFPRGGRSPQPGEMLSFEVERAPDGTKRAARVERPGHAPFHVAPREHARIAPPSPSRTTQHRKSGAVRIVAVLMLCALGAYAYQKYTRITNFHLDGLAAQPAPLQRTAEPLLAPASFQCDGRTYCSQMSSCTEAKFFLQHCPGVKMDGNNDGVPCEQQWCTSPVAK